MDGSLDAEIFLLQYEIAQTSLYDFLLLIYTVFNIISILKYLEPPLEVLSLLFFFFFLCYQMNDNIAMLGLPWVILGVFHLIQDKRNVSYSIVFELRRLASCRMHRFIVSGCSQ